MTDLPEVRPPQRLCWSIWARVYDPLIRAFAPWRQRSLGLLDAKPGETILLLGAGTGMDIEHLPRESRIVAVDTTPAMLSRLRARAQRLGLSVDARLMDAHVLDFPDGTFDAVVLHLILAIVADPRRCAREAARVLRSGGRAVVLDKFLPDVGRTPLRFRIANPFVRIFGTDITRRLGPIIEGSGLRVIHEEPAGVRGLFKIALLRKE